MNPQNNSFVLKPDGKLYWVKDMPNEPAPHYTAENASKYYEQAIQSAIDSAVEVSNQEALLYELYVAFSKEDKRGVSYFDWHQGILEPGKVYFLLCSVELIVVDCYDEGVCIGAYQTALVTFPESESQEETQEDWDKIFTDYNETNEVFTVDGEYVETFHPLEFKEYLKKYYTIPTRK